MLLITDRLALREFVPADWQPVYAYQRDPAYLQFYAWTDRTPDDVQSFIQMFVEAQGARPRTKWTLAITLRADDRLIGICSLRRPTSESTEAEIGYELAPQLWGQGLATEAARAIVRFGFAELGLHRLSARCVADNAASAHVLEKLGMRLEGRLRDHEWFKGRWWDTLLYGMLAGEGEEPRT